ncbi:MAG: hypothetical protein AB7F99_09130 [Vicinamibacterales bacterium]
MPDFSVRSDTVNVEQIMEQIRARIREKRGVDYTEDQIREMAAVKLERFLDPRGVRSDLLEQFQRTQKEHLPPEPLNYAFEDSTLYDSHRAPLRWIRGLLRPILKLFFNPNPLIQALHIQSRVNAMNAKRQGLDALHFEVLHNLVVETTRLSIEIKNLKMRVESLTSRLEFNERRARALESVVVYRPDQAEPAHHEPEAAPIEPGAGPTAPASPAEGPGQRSRRRRRRRGRRGGVPAASIMNPDASGPSNDPNAAPVDDGGSDESIEGSEGDGNDIADRQDDDTPHDGGDDREP